MSCWFLFPQTAKENAHEIYIIGYKYQTRPDVKDAKKCQNLSRLVFRKAR